MRKTYILLGLLGATMAFAQEGRVGINTENPNATLEVAGRPNNANVVDGFIAPKIDGPELRTKTLAGLYGEAQKGAIVYVTGAVRIAANRTGALVNVDSEGYYYFDGKVWVKFRPETPTYTAGNGIAINNGVISSTAPTYTAGANVEISNDNVISAIVPTYTAGNGISITNGQISAIGENTNIYTNDGTLAGNRTVTMGNRTLKFTGNNTSFVRNGEAISLKSLGANQASYIGFYKNGETDRNAYLGFGSATNNDFSIANTLGDKVQISTANTNGVTELASKLKINNLPVEHNANNALLVTDQQGNVKKANLYQAGNGITIDPATNTISSTATNTEPWYVQGGSIQATANNQNIYQNGTVGIGNFSNKRATNTLDVDGTLRVRNTKPAGVTATSLLGVDANGVVVRANPSNFVEANTVFATAPVNMPYNYKPESGEGLTKDLGIEATVRVPAGHKYIIVLQYSIPAGSTINPGTYEVVTGVEQTKSGQWVTNVAFTKTEMMKHFNAYIGARLLKNGVDLSEAARKYSFPYTMNPRMLAAMTTMNANYYEVLDNTRNTTEMTVTYKMQGYLEIMNVTAPNVAPVNNNEIIRFNMWSATGENYNWGRGSLSYQMYRVEE